MQRSGTLINVYKLMLGSPEIAEALANLGAALFTRTSLDDLDRELVILACAALFESEYEASQHLQLSRRAGVSDDQRSSIARHEWSNPCFDRHQSRLLNFVAAVATSPRLTTDDIRGLREDLTERQLVDIVVVCGAYFLIARLSTVFELVPDPPRSDLLTAASEHQHHHP